MCRRMARRGARQAPSSLVPRLWRGHWARARRWLRVLLVMLSVAGLTPLAEAVDLLLTETHSAEIAAASCGEDCGEGCADAGCHGDMHHCGCCAPMPRVAPSPAWTPSGLRGSRDRLRPLALLGPPERAPPPPWQPPRA
jgi:hypothetical protein